MNETLQTILSRYSCRAFTDEKLTRQELDLICRAAMAAPTAMNLQNYRVIAITDKALLKELDDLGMSMLKAMPDQSTYERFMQRGGTLFYNTPAMFMLPILKGGELDVGIVAENIALAAQSLGLGSCICGMARLIFENGNQDKYEKLFGFPYDYHFGMAVLVGHPAKDGTPHEPDMTKVSFI